MIFALLAILKYIGLVILILFALLLVVACILLFCPLSYKAAGRSTNVRFVVKWLFSAITFRLEYLDNKLRVDLLIFGRKRKLGKQSTAKNPKPKKMEKDPDSIVQNSEINKVNEEMQPIPPTLQHGENRENEDAQPESSSAQKRKEQEKRKKSTHKKEKNPVDNDENRFTRVFRLAKSFIDYPDRKIMVKKTIILLKRLLQPVKPSKFKLTGEVGFGSPDITGKFLAAESVFASFTRLQINIKGNFNRKCVDLNYSANGSFCLFSLLWPVVLYVFSKPIWKIIWKYINNKEEKNE